MLRKNVEVTRAAELHAFEVAAVVGTELTAAIR
jgi:hypothetical protein